MSTATSGDFLGGGGDVVDPFVGRAPLTLAEQAAAEDVRRQREIKEQARLTAKRNEEYNRSRTGVNTLATGEINPNTGKPFDPLERPEVDNSLSGVLSRGGQMVEDHPWLPLLPLAPLAMAALAPGAAGAGTIAAVEGTSAAAPAITTGGAVIEATAPTAIATGTTAAPVVAGGTTAAATGITGAEVIKDLATVAGITAPLAIHELTKGETPEEKRLLAKQEQLAQEAKLRQGQQQEAHMNALGQQLLAFNPRNQMMASMFGPDAAFAPTDFAQMVQNPIPPPQLPPELQNLQGFAAQDPQVQAKLRAFIQEQQRYEQGNQQRSDMMMNGIAQPGPGPKPLDPRTPQAARKY